GEKFHLSQHLLRKLNPGVNFDSVQAGTRILVPNVLNGIDMKRGKVSRVQVSKHNKWVMAFDANDNLMFYFPCTLGQNDKDPLPIGNYQITTPVKNPPFKYKPHLMWDDNLGKEYDIPPGPNSPVGNIWIGTT